MADYVPQSDAEFHAWVQNFIAYAQAHLVARDLVAADLGLIQSAQTAWSEALTAQVSAQATAQGARQVKRTTRQHLEAAVRALVNRLQASAAVDNAERQAMGITVRDGVRRRVSTPTTRPVGVVNASQRLRHIINFADASTPTSRAKPTGVLGCEVWVNIGGATPADLSELKFLATGTRTPYTTEYKGEEAGKMAHYMLRWVNTRGETGPWSATVSATIGG
jgi:hypothetical protein